MKKSKIFIKAICILICLFLVGNVEVYATEVMIVALEAECEQYTFKNAGYTNMLRVYGITQNGYRVDVTEKIQCFSEDENIVSVYKDILRAENKGKTYIVIIYQKFQLRLPVYVENDIDLDILEKELLLKAGCTRKDNSEYINILHNMSIPETINSSRTTQEILNKAVAMKNVQWIPKQDLANWGNNNPFKANVKQTGIPYSQNIQRDEVSFIYELNNNPNFYDVVEVSWWNTADEKWEKVPCAKYGVDCSGYVCFALDIDRCSSGQMVEALKDKTGQIVKVGNYDPNQPSKSALYNAYEELQPGYALARKGHAVLVLYNNTSSEEIIVYETVNRFPKMTTYTYEDLWGKRYFPFQRAD